MLMSSDESELEWEEVEPLTTGGPISSEPTEEQLLASATASTSSGNSLGPSLAGSVEITLGKDGGAGKGKNKAKDMFEKAFESYKKQLRFSLHKVHLLCLLSLGIQQSQRCNDPTLQCLVFSLLGNAKDLLYDSPSLYTTDSLSRLLRCFSDEQRYIEGVIYDTNTNLREVTVNQILVILLRALGLRTRLIMVLNPLSYKTTPTAKKKIVSGTGTLSPHKVKGCTKQGKSPVLKTVSARSRVDSETRKRKRFSNKCKSEEEHVTNCISGTVGSDCVQTSSKPESARRTRSSLRNRTSISSKLTTPEKMKSTNEDASSTTECGSSPYFKKKLKQSKPLKRKISSNSETDSMVSKESDSEDYSEIGGQAKQTMSVSFDSDDEFVPPKPKKKREALTKSPAKKLKKAVDNSNSSSSQDTLDSLSLSSTTTLTKLRGESDTISEQTSSDVQLVTDDDTSCWAEVFVVSKKKWTCVHLPSCSVGQPQLCERHCTLPLNYVVAFENGPANAIVRNVTPRYASDWCSRVYKQRLDREWWTESLRPFEPSSREEKEDEDEDITAMLFSQPLPSAITDYKHHPLYALKRHLLKFEAIYPEDSEILGFCRGEPVYPRQCVHTLHTRETWLKEGRMIRLNETAYKVVKARPKKGQSLLEAQQSTVEVFGRWQTEEYIAHPIVDGKVPRNEYGNVELFQPSMLPPGGAHIRIQGIQRVARKLEIDYAPAMMGWDFHSGYCHPVIDGILIAKENKEILIEAWDQEEQIRIDKDMKKREKRVIERWRRLTRCLLIKQRVKLKYQVTD